MSDIVAGYTVMIAQIPLALELNNAVVSRPTYDRIENNALVGKRTIGIVTNGIAQEVAIASGIGEIVLTIILVHP
jgi:hypothetical protein